MANEKIAAKRCELTHDRNPKDAKWTTKHPNLAEKLPQEIKAMIWVELLRDLGPSPNVEDPGNYTVNPISGLVKLQSDTDGKPSKEYRIDTGDFTIGWMQSFLGLLYGNRAVNENYLIGIAPLVLFDFTDPSALVRFADYLKTHTLPTTDLINAFHVRINIFADESNFAGLRDYNLSYAVHGDREDAREHMEEWIHAVERLPRRTTVHMVFVNPWRDYWRLRVLTFRRGLLHNYDIRVGVTAANWGRLMEGDMIHVAWLIAAIRGVSLPKWTNMLPEEARKYVRYGTIGFRGT